ncbi:secreted sialophosphoprotein [Phycomyces blakesleeanus]|uniref:Secreted sialophosphoprotein n=1 Tax=Phycomyces blakesleeanus TaxID=4837 RepID=A0ABR3AJG2_PHYBL
MKFSSLARLSTSAALLLQLGTFVQASPFFQPNHANDVADVDPCADLVFEDNSKHVVAWQAPGSLENIDISLVTDESNEFVQEIGSYGKYHYKLVANSEASTCELSSAAFTVNKRSVAATEESHENAIENDKNWTEMLDKVDDYVETNGSDSSSENVNYFYYYLFIFGNKRLDWLSDHLGITHTNAGTNPYFTNEDHRNNHLNSDIDQLQSEKHANSPFFTNEDQRTHKNEAHWNAEGGNYFTNEDSRTSVHEDSQADWVEQTPDHTDDSQGHWNSEEIDVETVAHQDAANWESLDDDLVADHSDQGHWNSEIIEDVNAPTNDYETLDDSHTNGAHWNGDGQDVTESHWDSEEIDVEPEFIESHQNFIEGEWQSDDANIPDHSNEGHWDSEEIDAEIHNFTPHEDGIWVEEGADAYDNEHGDNQGHWNSEEIDVETVAHQDAANWESLDDDLVADHSDQGHWNSEIIEDVNAPTKDYETLDNDSHTNGAHWNGDGQDLAESHWDSEEINVEPKFVETHQDFVEGEWQSDDSNIPDHSNEGHWNSEEIDAEIHNFTPHEDGTWVEDADSYDYEHSDEQPHWNSEDIDVESVDHQEPTNWESLDDVVPGHSDQGHWNSEEIDVETVAHQDAASWESLDDDLVADHSDQGHWNSEVVEDVNAPTKSWTDADHTDSVEANGSGWSEDSVSHSDDQGHWNSEEIDVIEDELSSLHENLVEGEWQSNDNIPDHSNEGTWHTDSIDVDEATLAGWSEDTKDEQQHSDATLTSVVEELRNTHQNGGWSEDHINDAGNQRSGRVESGFADSKHENVHANSVPVMTAEELMTNW